jgi:hypothetical protein
MHKGLFVVTMIRLIVAIPGLAGSCGVENPDFTGKWVCEIANGDARSARKISLDLKSDGSILTGTVSDTMGLKGGGGQIMSSRIVGVGISFKTNVGMNGETRTTRYDGRVCRDTLMLRITQGGKTREATARRVGAPNLRNF